MIKRKAISHDIVATALCFDPSPENLQAAPRRNRTALAILARAFDHLRPTMEGDPQKGIAPNGPALAGKILANAMLHVLQS